MPDKGPRPTRWPGPGTASAPTVKLIGPGTSIEHAFRVTVHLRSSEEWYRARRLGLDAIRIGSDQYELPLEVLLGLRRQGIAFDIVGGTTRLMVLPRALEQTSPQASMAPAQPGVSGFPTLATGSIELYSGQIDVYIEDNTGQGQYYRMRSQVAPAGAEVTDLRYRLRIDDDGDGAFYCGDYEIWLFSGDAAWETRVYNNLGGATDGGFDDDAADDSDIYLNFRSTSFFDGEDPNQWWGVLVLDNLSGDDGDLNYIEFQVDWEVSDPGDSYEPDNSAADAWPHPLNFTSGFRSIDPIGDQDWIKFTLAELSDVIVETIGIAGDTRLWLYDSGQTQIDYNDDGGTNAFSRIERSGAEALPAGLYYAKVDEYGNNAVIPDYGIELTADSAGLPDLVATTTRYSDASPAEGDTFWTEVDISNAGSAAAGASHARLFLSTDNDFDVGDDYEVTPEKSVSSLGPGSGGHATVGLRLSGPAGLGDLLGLDRSRGR